MLNKKEIGGKDLKIKFQEDLLNRDCEKLEEGCNLTFTTYLLSCFHLYCSKTFPHSSFKCFFPCLYILVTCTTLLLYPSFLILNFPSFKMMSIKAQQMNNQTNKQINPFSLEMLTSVLNIFKCSFKNSYSYPFHKHKYWLFFSFAMKNMSNQESTIL